MRKMLICVILIISIIILIYSAMWFLIINNISKNLNKEYSNNYINIQSIGSKKEYYVKFSKISSYGFPFKLAIQINHWKEEGISSIIEFKSPIYIGYDLLKESFFISYSGKAIGRYKPIESGFGAIFKINNYLVTIKIPLSLKLLKIFINKKDLFEIINYIKTLEFKSEKVEIFDLVDQQKLYSEDYASLSCAFNKSKYYNNIQDFLNNIPQKMDITYATKVSKSNLENKIIPAGLLLYGFAWPFVFDFESKLYIKTDASNFQDFFKNLEINMIYAKSSSKIHESLTNITYKGALSDKTNNNSYLKIDSQINLKQGFIDKIWCFTEFLIKKLSYFPNNENIISELKYIISNKDKFNFIALENRKYIVGLDMNVMIRPNNIIKTTINDLSIFSNNTGFRLTSEYNLDLLEKLDIKGLIILNNYLKIVDLFANYFFLFKNFRNFSDETKEIYIDSTKYFLKNISDHPESTSTNISFKYELNSSNVEKGKIGTVEMDKLIPLYYLSLYKKASERIRVGDNIIERMKELIPDFNNHQKLFEQLMIKPFQEIENDVSLQDIK